MLRSYCQYRVVENGHSGPCVSCGMDGRQIDVLVPPRGETVLDINNSKRCQLKSCNTCFKKKLFVRGQFFTGEGIDPSSAIPV